MIRVLLAEDHTIVRKGLRSLLERESSIRVVGEAGDGREALTKVETLQPHVVLMDIAMPGLNGLEATRLIKQRFPRVHVLVLTMHSDQEYVVRMLNAGASGYVLKHAAPEELLLAVRTISRGESFLSSSISQAITDQYQRQGTISPLHGDSYERLTPREREVLQLVAEGHSTREIAEMLVISIKTAETHRSNLMRKLDLQSTVDVTRYAIRKGIVSL